MSELKECPFCGGEAEVHNDYGDLINGGNREPYVRVRCTKCGITTKNHRTRIKNDKGLYSYSDEPETGAIKAWNTRAKDNAIDDLENRITQFDNVIRAICTELGITYAGVDVDEGEIVEAIKSLKNEI